MIFTKQDRITALESRLCPDPWGLGVELEIAHISLPAYQEWVRENIKKSPFARKQLEVMQGVASINAVVDEEKRSEAIAKYLANANLDVEITKRDVEGIALLVRGWRGEAEPYTHERAVEMLQLERDEKAGTLYLTPDDVELGEGDDRLEISAGTLLGPAIASWVLWEAGQVKRFREQRVEELEGESDASSGGSSRMPEEAEAVHEV